MVYDVSAANVVHPAYKWIKIRRPHRIFTLGVFSLCFTLMISITPPAHQEAGIVEKGGQRSQCRNHIGHGSPVKCIF
jgi:hypothetical protein